MAIQRCPWGEGDPLMLEYHDREWGVPVHDDRLLFEFLILEGAQAGLSWMTILRKRDAYRRAFKGFDPATVARFRETTVDRLLTDSTIVRNRAKIESAIRNARVVQAIAKESGTFDRYTWSFVGGQPKRNAWTTRAFLTALSILARLRTIAELVSSRSTVASRNRATLAGSKSLNAVR